MIRLVAYLTLFRIVIHVSVRLGIGIVNLLTIQPFSTRSKCIFSLLDIGFDNVIVDIPCSLGACRFCIGGLSSNICIRGSSAVRGRGIRYAKVFVFFSHCSPQCLNRSEMLLALQMSLKLPNKKSMENSRVCQYFSFL